MLLSKFKVTTAIAVFVAVISMLFSSCPEPEDTYIYEQPSGDASASSATVAGVGITLPEPHENWWEAEEGRITINSILSSGAAVVVTPAETESVIQYAKVSLITDTPEFGDGSTFDFSQNDYLYIKITSAGKNVLYYFFKVTLVNSNFDIRVKIGDKYAELADPVDSTWDREEMGKAGITPTQATSPVTVVVEKGYDEQKLRFAKSSAQGGTVSFEDNPDEVSSKDYTFEDGDLLFIEVTEKDGVYKMIYIIEVGIKKDIAILDFPLQIGSASQTAAGTNNPRPLFGSAGLSSGTSSITDRVNINIDAPLTAAKIIATPTADSGATVKYAVSRTEQITPPVFGTTDTFDFGYGSNWLDIQVTAEDGIAINYYRYRVNVGASVNTLTDAPFAIGAATNVVRGNPNANPVSATAVSVPIAAPQNNITVNPTKTDSNATLKFAKTTVETEIPVFGDSTTFSFPELGSSWFYIQVTAQNGTATYYRFRIIIGRDAELTGDVSIGSTTATPGTPNATATSAAAVPVIIATPGSLTINATASAGATVKYGISTAANQAPSSYTETASFTFGFGSTWLYIQVTPESKSIIYYRFQVMIGSDAKEITGVTITQGGTEYTASSIGTPNATMGVTAGNRGAIAVGALSGASTIEPQGLSENATASWVAVTNNATSLGWGQSYGTGNVTFSNTNTNLVLQITAQNGTVQYYRIVASVATP